MSGLVLATTPSAARPAEGASPPGSHDFEKKVEQDPGAAQAFAARKAKAPEWERQAAAGGRGRPMKARIAGLKALMSASDIRAAEARVKAYLAETKTRSRD